VGGEASLEHSPDRPAVQIGKATHCPHGVVDAADNEPGDTVVNHFRNRCDVPGDNGGAARHSLDHGQSERFGPVDGKQEGRSIFEEIRLVGLADLTDIAHVAMAAHQGLDLIAPVVAIDPVDLGGDAQLPAGPQRDLDSPVCSLLG
jgi:hypothetical protein